MYNNLFKYILTSLLNECIFKCSFAAKTPAEANYSQLIPSGCNLIAASHSKEYLSCAKP